MTEDTKAFKVQWFLLRFFVLGAVFVMALSLLQVLLGFLNTITFGWLEPVTEPVLKVIQVVLDFVIPVFASM